MDILLDRLKENFHWVVFLILELLSGFLLFQFNSYQGSVWFTQANAISGCVLDWQQELLSYVHLKQQNELLTERNFSLQLELQQLREEYATLRHDSTYGERHQQTLLSSYQLIPARVVGNSVHRKDNYLTINRGSADGVQPEMGVVSGTGVVGIVAKVTPHYALVMSLLNSHSSISCRIRGTNYFGYLKWSGGSALRAHIDDIPRHARCKVGDAVESNGFSNVFPEGIFIGRVAQIHDSADGLAYQLEVLLSTDLAHLQNVSVISNYDRLERDSLTQPITRP